MPECEVTAKAYMLIYEIVLCKQCLKSNKAYYEPLKMIERLDEDGANGKGKGWWWFGFNMRQCNHDETLVLWKKVLGPFLLVNYQVALQRPGKLHGK
jgi:hypothetical protein